VAERLVRSPFVVAGPRGPVPGGGQAPWHGTVSLEDRSEQPSWQLHGKTAQRLTQSRPYRPGAVLRRGELMAWSFSPAQWRAAWTGAPLGVEGRVPDALWADLSPEDVTDLTHGTATARMTGASAPDVLARICPVDLRRLSDDHAVRTSMAQVSAEVLRADRDAPTYLLSVSRSYGPYFWSLLSQAAAELDAEVGPALARRVTDRHHHDG
jgi:heterotetrameric sarcosine oxidase gamma subunit